MKEVKEVEVEEDMIEEMPKFEESSKEIMPKNVIMVRDRE